MKTEIFKVFLFIGSSPKGRGGRISLSSLRFCSLLLSPGAGLSGISPQVSARKSPIYRRGLHRTEIVGDVEMSIYELLEYGGGITVFLMTIIQVSAIEINPWSFVARKIGKAINQELFEKVSKIEKDLERIGEKQDGESAVAARIRILRFADEMQEGRKHTKEHFDQTMEDIDIYENYCSKHPDFRNNIATMTISYIKDNYKERLENHDFLQITRK